MSTDVERLIARLEVSQRQFERQMARAAQTTNRRAAQIEQRFAQTNRTVTAQFAAMGAQVNTVLRTLALPTLTFGGGLMLARQVRSAVSELSELGKQARIASMDVEELQGLMFGLGQATGASGDAIAGAFERFNRRIGEAANGLGPLNRTVERYGIAVRDANGHIRSQSDLLREVAEAIRNASSEQERAAIGQAAFGDIGRRLAIGLAEGADGIDRLIAQARDAGVVIDRDLIQRAEILDDKFDQLTKSVGRFFKTLFVGLLAGGVETPLDRLEQMFGTIERAQMTLDTMAPGLFEELTRDVQEFERLSGAVETTAQSIEDMRQAFRGAVADVDTLAGELYALGEIDLAVAAIDLSDALVEAQIAFDEGRITAEEFESKVRDGVEAAKALTSQLSEVDAASLSGIIGRFNSLIARIREATAETRALKAEASGTTPEGIRINTPGEGTVRPRPRGVDDFPDISGGRARGGGGRSSPGDFERAVQQIRERTEALEAEAVAILSAADAGENYTRALDMARMRSQLLTAAQREGVEVAGETADMVERMAVAYADAAQRIREIGEAQAEAARRAQAMQSAFEDAFVSFVTGANSARDAARSLLQSLARLAAQRAFTSLAGALGFSLPGRATGGPVRAGGAYLVNENTPQSEVFVPSQSGGILNVPQAQAALRGAAGGKVTVHVVAQSDPGVILDVAESAAIRVTRAGLEQYDRQAAPGTFGRVSRDPRRRG